MLGAPASGKGSVAELLSKHYKIPAISSGDIFRKNISEETELGLKAKEFMDKGLLVPDDITINMIKDRLKEPDTVNGMILDGFPRTVAQAKALDEMLEKDGKQIDCVVNLESKEEEVLARVVNRRVCPKCKAIFNTVLHPSKVEGICDNCGSKIVQREDDTLERAKNRLVVYHKETAPVAKYYEKTGKLFSTLLSESANRMKNEVAIDVIEHMKGK
jgi:adenylate kinase